MKWFKEVDWSFVGLMLVFVLLVGGIFGDNALMYISSNKEILEQILQEMESA